MMRNSHSLCPVRVYNFIKKTPRRCHGIFVFWSFHEGCFANATLLHLLWNNLMWLSVCDIKIKIVKSKVQRKHIENTHSLIHEWSGKGELKQQDWQKWTALRMLVLGAGYDGRSHLVLSWWTDKISLRRHLGRSYQKYNCACPLTH